MPTLTVYRIHQVFSHLTPRDIIHLSRTSRFFQDTLMMRNAIAVWKAARDKGAPAIECRTYTRLVSPAEGPKKKKWRS